MEGQHPRSDRSSKVSRFQKYLFWALITAVTVLAIVIPLAVMFGKKKPTPLHSEILVPLYVYPAPGAWRLLYTAIADHPTLNFTVVINPASGPGPGSIPDANYTREIPLLNAYANVRTVGYVSTDYARRDLRSILRDIDLYSGWAEVTTADLSVRGIFLDETPTQYDGASAECLGAVARHIQSAPALGKNPFVIHNPGAIPDTRYMDLCDLSVLYEGTYSTYHTHALDKKISSFRTTADIDHKSAAVIIHGLPTTLSSQDQYAFIQQTRRLAGSVFITGLATDYYASFWEGWASFVDGMDQ